MDPGINHVRDLINRLYPTQFKYDNQHRLQLRQLQDLLLQKTQPEHFNCRLCLRRALRLLVIALQQQQLAQAASEGGPSSCCQSAVEAYPGRVAASVADLQLVEAPRLFISLPGKAKPRWQIEKLDYTDC